MARMIEHQEILQCLLSYEKFKKMYSENKEAVELIASEIELGIKTHADIKARENHIHANMGNTSYYEIYANISYNVKMNLDINSSVNCIHEDETRTYLCESIFRNFALKQEFEKLHKSGDIDKNADIEEFMKQSPNIDPMDLGSMNCVQLNPLINQKYTDEIKHRENQKYSEKFSTMHTCAKCKGKKTKEQEVQKRSLDEGGTLIVTCLNCGNRWSP